MQTIPQHDHSHNSSEDGTNKVPSSVHVDGPPNKYTSSHIDDSTLVTSPSSQSSSLSSPHSHSSISHLAPSSPSVDVSRVKRSRSVSSHSSSDTDSEDERAPKRHHSDSDEDSVMQEERTHESVAVILNYGEHQIRVLTTNDGTRVVVAKDFLLLTGISKENCARTTKNLIEGRDKRMMHVPSNYCMMKGQQAVVLTLSGLSQLVMTSRRLKQSTALLAWIKQTLMPVLQGTHTTTHNNNHTNNNHDVHMQSQTQTSSQAQTKSKRIMVKAKRSKSKSPSTSPVMTPTLTSPSASPLALSPSHSPRSLSRHTSSSSESCDDTSTPHSPLQDLSTAAAMLNITMPVTMPSAPLVGVANAPAFAGFPMSTGFSTRIPTFPFRRTTPLMGVGMTMGVPRFSHPAAHKLLLGA